MTSLHSSKIAANFGAKAQQYETHATLQHVVAGRLAARLPALSAPRVLELGCGTGLLSRHLRDAYPDGDFVFSDLSPDMLAQAKANLGAGPKARCDFQVVDAADTEFLGRFDLIATSMCLHWLDDPAATLKRLRSQLKPGGTLLYAGLGPKCFSQWRASLRAEGLAEGIVPIAPLPGLLDEESVTMEENGLAFLQRLRAFGGLTPKDGYEPLPPGALRRALHRLQKEHDGKVSWHVVYGRLSSMESSLAPSRSSASMIPS